MRFQVLGSIDVVRDGVPVGVGGPQQRRLLGVLLIARSHLVTTDRLVETLWPDGDAPDGAPRSVVTYVSRLRAALGDGFVETQGSSYRLRVDGATFDVVDFEALVTEAESSLPDRAVDCYDRALALWGGDAFGEFTGEWWARSESTRLADLRTVAREERAGALIALGHHARAVPDLDGLVLEHPLRERPVSLLMQALVATGRQADALRAFRAFRARLGEETGLEPSAGLVALEREVAGAIQPSGEGVGRPLRGYVIHEAIGEGSHGRVYVATQPGTERRVAIKAIRPDLADSSDFIRRFEAEARLVGRLEHPHIVPLYDFWREPGGAYLVFRYMAGGTARDAVISGGPWSLPRVSQLVEEVGGALIVAHAAGVVHHDVKASNVLLDECGAAYLGDFGIAAHDADDQRVDALGVRDDVHDFGWILWELLTAAPPEPGSMAPTGGRPERGAAPSLVGRTGDVPEGLDAVLARATDPAGGYSTIAELVLGWRAAVGRPDGVLSPVTSDERRVVDSARRLAARRLAEATAAGINPYKGLRPFDEADAAGFFGRDAVADELAEWVAHHRLVTVVGPSGSGKSSLVRAGLMPRLRATGSTVAAMVPGQDPVAALRQALSELSSRRGRNTDVLAWIRHVVAACGPLVVVIDQFEECWSRGDVDRRAAFIADLARLVDSDLDVRFVATIRADVFDRPLEEPRLGTHVGSGAFVIASMSPAQLADAITLPAARAGISVNDAVVADLVTDAVNQPGSLPLLQFTLAEMYDRRVDGRIGPDALAAVGGMAGSIGRRAEDVHASLDASAQEDAHLLFSRLVIPGEAAPDTRRRARLSELPAGARAVADRYADARLLVTDRDQVTREPTVEIAHEALLTRWSRLAGWVDADRTWLAQLQHLAASARAWDERGRPPADLYRGSRLEAAIESIDAGRDVTDSERDFVEAGGDARDSEVRSARRTARRLRRLLVGVGVLLVLAIVAGTLAYVGQQRARDEERDAAHRALVSDSTALRSSDRDLAALLAVEAHRLDPSPATESALFGTFTAVPGLERTVHPGVEHEGGAVLIDDETMAVQRITGGARVIDIATGEVKYSLTMLDGGADSYITWLDATPDGRYLAMAWRAEDRGVLNVFDLATQRARFENVDVPYAMGNVAISPDGSLVAIGGGADARADVYDAATGELLVELDPIPRPEDAVLVVNTVALAFRSDDELIVTSQTGTIRIVDPTTGRELKRFQGDRETAEAFLLLSGDANSMVTLGWHGINRYDLVSGEALWPRPLLGDPAETGRTCTLGLAERLGVALCGQDDGVVRAIDLDTGVLGSTDIGPRAGRICSLMDTPDGSQLVATVCESNEYIVWRLDGGGAVSRAMLTDDSSSYVFGYTADDLAILSEDQLAQDESVTRLVDVATRTAEPLPGIFAPVPTGDPSVVVARFDDGRGTASTGLYDLTTRTAASPTFDLDFEPFGALEVDGSFYVWGDENGDVAEFLGHVAAVGPDGRIRFEVAAPFTSYLYVAATDADHVVVVKCEKRTDCVLQRLDPATGAPVGEPSEDEAGYSRVVATPGLLIALTGAGQIRVIDPETLLPVGAPLPRIPGGAESLSLSDDGRRLLVLGQDAAFRVYDVPSRTQLGGPVTVGDFASGAALRGDGLEAAVGTDHGIVLWDLDAAHWIDGACAVAGRNLTRAEWDQYIGDLASYRTTCSEYAPAE